MGVEVMVYVYGAICLSMIFFNIVYNLSLRRRPLHLEKRCRRIGARMAKPMEAVGNGQPVGDAHLQFLEAKLRRVKNLIAFDRVLQILADEKQKALPDYLRQIYPVVLHLAVLYQKRDNMQAAYFSYFLSRYVLQRQTPMDSVQQIMLDYIRIDNLYCRVNALQALYAFGSVESVVKALQIQDKGGVFLHEKILTEGLLSFAGDHNRLIERLWRGLGAFSAHTQLAVLNYVRFQSGAYTEQMFAILTDAAREKELRLAAVRYFGRYRYDRALQPLLTFAAERDPAQWEYAAVSVSALAQYPGDRVVDVLKTALHSANWHVRYNAAVSLEAHRISYGSLVDIVAGNDRYAREMMMYRLESRKLQETGV